MNDKIIINIISKIYFSMVSFFIFMFSLLLIVFFTLQNGLFIKDISLSNIHVHQLYIKWDEKIDISLKELSITNKKSTTTEKINYKEISKYLKLLSNTTKWFNSILVEKISLNNFTASFEYRNGEKGFLFVSSENIELNASLYFDTDILNIEVSHALDKKRKIQTSASLYFDPNAVSLYVNANININNDSNFTIYCDMGIERLTYNVVSNNKIDNAQYLVNLFSVPKHVKYWVSDAVGMSSLDITEANGYINYNDIANAHKSLNLKATANQLSYAYNPKLDSIRSASTELEFKDGILYIQPKDAYTYGMYLDKSKLKIDFTGKEEVLTLNLLFDGIANEDMLKILSTYKIKLPFLQKSGTINTDLELSIGLSSIDVDAKGKFFTKEANFDYVGLNIDVFDAYIELNNAQVTIDKMKVAYKDIATASVKVRYNANKSIGTIAFDIDSAKLSELSLSTKNAPLKVQYNIVPKEDSINVAASNWKVEDNLVSFDAVSLPFNLHNLQLTVPTTFLEFGKVGNGFLAGTINLKDMTADLTADVLKFSYNGIKFSQSNTSLKLKYDKSISIFSNNEIFFNVSGSQCKASNLLVTVDNQEVSLKHTMLSIGRYVTAKAYANYNMKSKKSHISLTNFTLKNPNTGSTIYKKNKILLSASIEKGNVKIKSGELRAEFSSGNDRWKLKLDSINKLSSGSNLLKQLHITDGEITLYKNKDEKSTRFNAKILYPYKILVDNNQPISNYIIKGKINKEQVYFNINKKVNISITDDIKINMDTLGLNVPEALRAIREVNVSTEGNASKNITLYAKNSYLYLSEKRKILTDNISAQYYDKALMAQLEHSKGVAGLKIEDEKFYLYGKDFNDKFMENLFSYSKFSGGSLDFILNGSLTDYSGIFYVNNTIIKEYKTLNNILAFINTVPSLITFSLPGYNQNGMLVEKAYVKFSSKNSDLNLSDIYLDSKEIDILGHGVANIKNDTVDVTLNLKTDLGSNFSKVPLVGYVFFDEDSISTTLNISGALSDPQIKSLIAQDIVVAPFNIIKRTLTLPYKLIKDVSQTIRDK